MAEKSSVAALPSSSATAAQFSDPFTKSDDKILSTSSTTCGSSELTTTENASCTTLDVTNEKTSTTHNQLPTLRLLLAHIGAAMTLFLATTDATIVSTSLPTIASELKASQTQYTWVGVAYMLTQTAFQPLYGRISDLVGRKNVLYSSMAIFSLGSLLCGVAQSVRYPLFFTLHRESVTYVPLFEAGIGGGGIVSAVWVITAEIVEVANRAKWSQALSVTWSCSAIAGPLLGGLFSGRSRSGSRSSVINVGAQGDHHTSNVLSWRWGFYLNLPICLVALLILLYALRDVSFQKTTGTTWHTLAQRFDFGGLFLFMLGSGLITVGFSFAAENGWASASTLCLIIFGLTILLCGGLYEKYTTRDCLFPETTFKDITTIVILLISFLHNFAFNAGTFYLALYFQAATGSPPFEAGLKMLPYSLGSSLASIPAAWFIGFWQKKTHDTSGQRLVIIFGLLISTLGFGLLILLDEHSRVYAQILYLLIAGIGLGMLFHAPYQVFTRALKSHELASGTSAFFLVRFSGATIGLAVAGAIFYARTASRIPSGLPSQLLGSSVDYSQLQGIEPPWLKQQVLRIVSSSLQTVWIVCAPCLGLASLVGIFSNLDPIQYSDSVNLTQISLLIRRMPIDRESDASPSNSFMGAEPKSAEANPKC
ncbi:hypothetical protein AMATHDRAFT_5092 [Amanita thiersii Skay4041]|uniref:Major facilitator superfamily (MFS) profile domain-containing protein n=1 Tax=Amanita thiersii Skay4041 TaxID=703135 RepID=A0A2A9NN96_9AGAR|nr:hypothetical protein AMATHDRAFT_5092 [Amanita thiersii Skay4041]